MLETILLNHSQSTKVAESVVPDAYKSPFMAYLSTRLGAQSEVAIGALDDFDVNGCELLVAQSLWKSWSVVFRRTEPPPAVKALVNWIAEKKQQEEQEKEEKRKEKEEKEAQAREEREEREKRGQDAQMADAEHQEDDAAQELRANDVKHVLSRLFIVWFLKLLSVNTSSWVSLLGPWLHELQLPKLELQIV